MTPRHCLLRPSWQCPRPSLGLEGHDVHESLSPPFDDGLDDHMDTFIRMLGENALLGAGALPSEFPSTAVDLAEFYADDKPFRISW